MQLWAKSFSWVRLRGLITWAYHAGLDSNVISISHCMWCNLNASDKFAKSLIWACMKPARLVMQAFHTGLSTDVFRSCFGNFMEAAEQTGQKQARETPQHHIRLAKILAQHNSSQSLQNCSWIKITWVCKADYGWFIVQVKRHYSVLNKPNPLVGVILAPYASALSG